MQELILKQDVPKLGKVGDVIKAKDGFARNFLIPNGLAAPATKENLKKLEQEKLIRQKALEETRKDALEVAKKLSGKSFTISSEVHEEDKLYGSITSVEIHRVLEDEGFKIDKKAILLDEPIKSTGIFEVPVKLHPEVTTNIKIWIVKK
ncbi:MAG: 50S ribosomal protein L9 [Candidatus Omnitrophica bacterium]|nr:50S ribosomal protein L9 [Candidatus Omnitrophota bacterium]MDD5610099.1 50S ribosomal protein L9 [Candidatus Omnitrophota bacterium]